MKCKRCGSNSAKNGKIKSTGKQRYYCKYCRCSFVEIYERKSFEHDIDDRIIALVKESCGIRSISRILKIAPNTVLARIKLIASKENPKKVTVQIIIQTNVRSVGGGTEQYNSLAELSIAHDAAVPSSRGTDYSVFCRKMSDGTLKPYKK